MGKLLSFRIIVAFMAFGLVSCVTESMNGSGEPFADGPKGLNDLVFHYRQQALRLYRLADDVVAEAQLSVQQKDPNSPEVLQKLAEAKEFRIQAEAAFEQAREYRSRMPHNQVY